MKLIDSNKRKKKNLPQLNHAINEFFFGELALCGRFELPSNDEHDSASGVDLELLTEA